MLEPVNQRLKVKAAGLKADVGEDIKDHKLLAKALNTDIYSASSASAPRRLCNQVVELWCLVVQREVYRQIVDAICKNVKDA